MIKKCLELWAGDSTGLEGARTLSLSHVKITTVEINPEFEPSICMDILDVTVEEIRHKMKLAPNEKPFFIWASPDCSVFSVAGFGHGHFSRDNVFDTPQPASDKAKEMVKRHKHTLDLIMALDPVYFVIENPRGLLRKMPFMQHLPRETVTYCQYGDFRMKPTDLWGKFPASWNPRPMCKNGDSCHEASPRGAMRGTSRLSHRKRSHIPLELSEEIWQAALIDNGECRRSLGDFV